MTDPSGYQRPDRWQDLNGAPKPTSDATAGAERVTPAEPTGPQPSTWSPEASAGPRSRPVRRKWGRLSTGLIVLCITVALVTLVAVGHQSFTRWTNPADAGPTPTDYPGGPSSTAPDVDTDWKLTARTLRPELDDARFVFSPGGSVTDRNIVVSGDTWLVLTGDDEDGRLIVHGVDGGTGRETWRRETRNALCADHPLPSGRFVCAGAIDVDPPTQAGTRWVIATLDPATGEEGDRIETRGRFTMIKVIGDRIVLIEERDPAPHAVVRALSSRLEGLWTTDVSSAAGHDQLFSLSPTYLRKLPRPAGPALSQAMVTAVSDQLIALTSDARTAFVDLRSGRVLGVPECARLVDAGTRVWCAAGGRAVAYSATIKPLSATERGVTLARTCLDGATPTVPVFLADDGTAVRVDPRTGRTIGTLAQSRVGTRSGHLVTPTGCQLGSMVMISDTRGSFMIDASKGKLRWQTQSWTLPAHLIQRDGRVLVAAADLFWIDPGTGRILSRRGQIGATQAAGEALAQFGYEQIARVREP